MNCRCREHWGYSCGSITISCGVCAIDQTKHKGWVVLKDQSVKENRYVNVCPKCKKVKRNLRRFK